MSFNPYEPPCLYASQRQSEFVIEGDLSKASRYLSRMGALSVVYFCVVWIGSVIGCLNDHSLNPALKLLFISVPMMMIVFTASLTRAALLLAADPTRHLRKARWLAILLGTFFFPFLTWPAYIATRNMTQYVVSKRQRTCIEHAADYDDVDGAVPEWWNSRN